MELSSDPAINEWNNSLQGNQLMKIVIEKPSELFSFLGYGNCLSFFLFYPYNGSECSVEVRGTF